MPHVTVVWHLEAGFKLNKSKQIWLVLHSKSEWLSFKARANDAVREFTFCHKRNAWASAAAQGDIFISELWVYVHFGPDRANRLLWFPQQRLGPHSAPALEEAWTLTSVWVWVCVSVPLHVWDHIWASMFCNTHLWTLSTVHRWMHAHEQSSLGSALFLGGLSCKCLWSKPC